MQEAVEMCKSRRGRCAKVERWGNRCQVTGDGRGGETVRTCKSAKVQKWRQRTNKRGSAKVQK